MWKKVALILVFLSAIHRLHSLPTELQNIILRRLGLDRPPRSRNESTTCINFYKTLNLVDEQYNDVKCYDLLEVNHDNFVFAFAESAVRSNRFAIRIFSRVGGSDEVHLRISAQDNESFISRALNHEDRWLEIDVTQLVQWPQADKDQKAISFKIQCFSSGTHLNVADRRVSDCITDQVANEPVLISFSRETNVRRTKRQSIDQTEDEVDLGPYSESDDQSRYCETVAIYYKFEDFGWDNWIISPKGFTSSFCRGQCSFPLRNDVNSSNHAIVQSLMQIMYPDQFSEPCCISDKTESLQIVYLDEDNTPRFKKLNDIIIRSCRCA